MPAESFKSRGSVSLRLLFILTASSLGMARLLRGSGTRYFTSSLATFQEMAILLLTQEHGLHSNTAFPESDASSSRAAEPPVRTTTRSLGLILGPVSWLL